MAATVTKIGADNPGKGRTGPLFYAGGASTNPQIAVYTVAFDNSYPTGGEAVSDVLSDFATIDGVFVLSTGGARVAEWDGSQTAPKVKLFTALGTEAANASDQSTITVRIAVVGERKRTV